MAHGTLETEIKLAVANAPAARRRLRAAGFRISRPRVFEANTLYDTPDGRLRRAGSMLRVREVKSAAKLTFKGPVRAGRFKSREELEVDAGEAKVLCRILERLGFQAIFRYEKYRAEWRRDAGGVATLDETPIGVYLELEGSSRWIDRTAKRLGFTGSDYLTASYWRLYADRCASQGRLRGNMVFS